MKNGILLITEKCNGDCFFCFNDKNKGHTDVDAVIKKIDEISEHSKERIIITGGEPLLHPDFKKILSHIKKQRFNEVILQTNGIDLSTERFKEYYRLGVNSFLYSLHSSNEGTYNKITRTDNKFKAVIKNIKDSINSGARIGLSYVINIHNYQEIYEDIVFFARNFKGIITIEIGYNHKFNDWQNIEYPKLKDIEIGLNKALKYLRKNNIKFLIANCGIPLCYLSGFEHMTAQAVEYFENKNCSEIGKNTKDISEPCKRCYCRNLCPGLQVDYYNKNGDKELYPLFIDPKTIIDRIKLRII